MVEKQTNFHHINDYFLVLIGSLSGLRISEIAGLKISMVNQKSIDIVGKGNKKRIIPLGKKGQAAIDQFIKLKKEVMNQETKPVDFLFVTRRNKPFTRHGINQRLKKWCRTSEIKEYSFHSLRHYYATYCLNSGFNLAEVQRFLGHSSVTITSMYLHFTSNTQDKIDSVL